MWQEQKGPHSFILALCCLLQPGYRDVTRGKTKVLPVITPFR